MSEVITGTRVEGGFTTTGDPLVWCVCKGLSSEAVAELEVDPPTHPMMMKINFRDLHKQESLRLCVESLLSYPRAHMLRPLGSVLGFFMSDGALLAPLSSLGQKMPARLFKTDMAVFVERVVQEIGIANPSVHAKRVIENLWLCTLEGRKGTVSKEAFIRYLKLYLHPQRKAGVSGAKKWLPGLTDYIQTGLIDLSHELKLRDLGAKQAKYEGALSKLVESESGREWKALWDKFLGEERPGSMPRFDQAFKLLARYLNDNPAVASVEAFMNRKIGRIEPVDYCAEENAVPHKMTQPLRVLHRFAGWILNTDDRFSSIDDLGSDRIVRPEYYNPVRLGRVRESEDGRRKRPPETVQMALPLEYLDEIEKLLTEDEMAWPKTSHLDWIEAKDPETGVATRVFCPVMPQLTRLLILLPLRGGQARRLDSGEGDRLYFDHANAKWTVNKGVHAGYWERLGVANPKRGALRMIVDTWSGETLCGIYVNSNKTSDKKSLFDETSGYVISWQNEAAIAIINEMRAWQEKWNPLEGPTKYTDLRDSVFEKMHESVAKRRPDVFYLFRYPAGNSYRHRTSPPSSQQFRMYWYEVLAELERRLKARGLNPPELISSWSGGHAQSSPYTPHGLRHSGLTRLAQAGVHPWILKNIVAGHADYIMTLYYIKPNPAHISAHLNEKYMQVVQGKQEEFKQFLASKTLSEVHKLAVARGPDAFTALDAIRKSVGNSAAAMSSMDHGVCPNGRTRCDEGAKLSKQVRKVRRDMDRLNAPVPNVDGVPDCTQCIYFITGTPFVDGLRVKTNEVSVAASNCARRYQTMLGEINKLEGERIEIQDARQIEPVKKLRLATLKQQIKTEGEALTIFATSLHSHTEMFQKVRSLLKAQAEAGESNVPALLYSEEPEFQWGLLPRFEAIDELVHAARWYPSVRAEEMSRERTLEVTKMLVRQGAMPIFALLTDEEARAAVDAMTAYLFLKLSRSSVRKLFGGVETLESLGLVDDVEKTLTKAIGRPVTLSIKTPLDSSPEIALENSSVKKKGERDE